MCFQFFSPYICNQSTNQISNICNILNFKMYLEVCLYLSAFLWDTLRFFSFSLLKWLAHRKNQSNSPQVFWFYRCSDNFEKLKMLIGTRTRSPVEALGTLRDQSYPVFFFPFYILYLHTLHQACSNKALIIMLVHLDISSCIYPLIFQELLRSEEFFLQENEAVAWECHADNGSMLCMTGSKF